MRTESRVGNQTDYEQSSGKVSDYRNRQERRESYSDVNRHKYDDDNSGVYCGDLDENGDRIDSDPNSSMRSYDEKGGDKWMTDTPTNTVLLKQLPFEVDEKDVRQSFQIL